MLTKTLPLTIMAFIIQIATMHAQSPYSTINGTVWKETLPVNNVMNSGEQNIAGMLITLRDITTDEIISSAVSAPDGTFSLQNFQGPGSYYIQYTYPLAGYTLVAQRAGSDNTINSAADPSTSISDQIDVSAGGALTGYNLGLIAIPNTLTHCAEKDFTITIWNYTFSLPKFNIPGDSLTKATLFVADAASHPSIGVENTGNQAADVDLGFAGRLTITPPTGTNLITNTSTERQISLTGYDGVTDYAGSSGYTWFNLFSSNMNSRAITSVAQLASYSGSGSVNLISQAKSTTSITGSGNLESNVVTHVGAGVCVTYQYTAATFLPVSLTTISASTDGIHTFLKWTTAMEYHNKGFAVERSTDGKNFREIDFVKSLAPNGTSSSNLEYEYTDLLPIPGNNYYRLNRLMWMANLYSPKRWPYTDQSILHQRYTPIQARIL